MSKRRNIFCVSAVVILIVGLLGVRAWRSQEVETPPSMAFLGYTLGSNGFWYAKLRLSNSLSERICYEANTTNRSQVLWMTCTWPIEREPGRNNGFSAKSITAYVPTASTNVDLAAGATVDFSVHMMPGTSNLEAMVWCVRGGKPRLWQKVFTTIRSNIFKGSPVDPTVDLVELRLPDR